MGTVHWGFAGEISPATGDTLCRPANCPRLRRNLAAGIAIARFSAGGRRGARFVRIGLS